MGSCISIGTEINVSKIRFHFLEARYKGGSIRYLTPGATTRVSQCMMQENFMREGDTCVHDPATCATGLSFSLWHKSVFDTDAFTPRDGLPYRYLISTGERLPEL